LLLLGIVAIVTMKTRTISVFSCTLIAEREFRAVLMKFSTFRALVRTIRTVGFV